VAVGKKDEQIAFRLGKTPFGWQKTHLPNLYS
jgi:hypothetical protein